MSWINRERRGERGPKSTQLSILAKREHAGRWTKGLIIRKTASVLPGLCARVWTLLQAQRARPRPSRVTTCVPGRWLARPLRLGGVAPEEVGETPAADLLHLAQCGVQLLRGWAVQPARPLAGHRRPVAEARGERKGEAGARAVLRVELGQPEPLGRAQARVARGALLPLRLGAELAPLQLAARQVRVPAQDALLACGEAQTRGGSALPRPEGFPREAGSQDVKRGN